METPVKDTYAARRGAFLTSAQDYSAHAQRVNGRLARARKSLKVHSRDTKHFVHKTSKDPRYAEVLLLKAERDVLHAQAAKLAQESHASRSRAKFVIAKLGRAFQTGQALCEFVGESEDQYLVLECLAYVAIVEGSLNIARKRYTDALGPLAVARCVLQCIHSTKDASEVYYDVIDTTVDPALKVAFAQGLGSKPADAGAVAKEFASKVQGGYLARAVELIKGINPAYVIPGGEAVLGETVLLDSITWFDYTAKVESEDVAQAIMSAHEGEKAIVETDPASFDGALLAYDDAIALQEERMARNGNDDGEAEEEHIVLTYVNYNALLLKVRRDLALVEVANAAATATGEDGHAITTQASLIALSSTHKLLDNLAVHVQSLRDLPGVANLDSLYDSLGALGEYFAVQRLVTLAKAHLLANNYRESLAVTSLAQDQLGDISNFSVTFGWNLPTNAALDALKTAVDALNSKLYVLARYFSGANAGASQDYVIDNYAKFPSADGNNLLNAIAPLGADVKPVAVKPVLFDIAYNYVQYDNGAAPQASNTAAPSPSAASASQQNAPQGGQQKGSFFGLFNRS